MTDPTPQTTPTRDEAVARIIDPESWAAYDHAYSMQVGEFRRFADRVVKRSLATAKAVLALLDLASAPAPASGGVDAAAVKALEWQADPFSDALIADTNGLGRYVIAPYEGQFKVTGGNVRSLKPTVEAAQIKAQADYEHRIRSALTPAATPVSEAGGRPRKIIRKATMIELLAAIYEAEGWKRAEGESRTKRAQEVYAITTEPQHNRYVATPLASLSPAATPVSEAGGEATGKPSLQVADIPRAPNTGRYLAETNDGRLLYLNHANEWQEMPNILAKPASSPAGGDVVEALKAIAEGYAVSVCDDRYIIVDNPAYRPDDGSSPKLVLDTASLSQSTSAGRVGE